MRGDPRSLRPPIAAAYAETVATVLEGGIVDRPLKQLCFRALAGEDVEPADERERAALDWAYAIEWDADRADDDLWARLHAHFSVAELVELGYAIAFQLGQRHWERTLSGPLKLRSPSPRT
jgi:alkylhydroperoxidase family enzyme